MKLNILGIGFIAMFFLFAFSASAQATSFVGNWQSTAPVVSMNNSIVKIKVLSTSDPNVFIIINSDNPEELANRIISDSLNVREVEDLVREEKIEKARRVPVMFRTESKIKFINSEHLVALENEIAEKSGLDCKISYNGFKGVGKIILKFDEIDKIQRLLESLKS